MTESTVPVTESSIPVTGESWTHISPESVAHLPPESVAHIPPESVAHFDRNTQLILFENVPRITTRGRWLLDQIGELLRV